MKVNDVKISVQVAMWPKDNNNIKLGVNLVTHDHNEVGTAVEIDMGKLLLEMLAEIESVEAIDSIIESLKGYKKTTEVFKEGMDKTH